MVNRSSNDYLLLFFEKEAAQLRHYGVNTSVPEGCFVLLDNQQPYELLRENGGASLAMRLESRPGSARPTLSGRAWPSNRWNAISKRRARGLGPESARI